MDENLTSHVTYRISGMSSPVCRVIAIRDRMPRFHEDSRNPRVSPDIAMQHKMNTKRTNAHENERKRSSGGHPYPPTRSMRDAGEIAEQVFTTRLAEAVIREFSPSQKAAPGTKQKKTSGKGKA
jgi:hypothetical protein